MNKNGKLFDYVSAFLKRRRVNCRKRCLKKVDKFEKQCRRSTATVRYAKKLGKKQCEVDENGQKTNGNKKGEHLFQ